METNNEKSEISTDEWIVDAFPNLNLVKIKTIYPKIPKPFSDELLSSWLTRLAYDNLTSVYSIFWQLKERIHNIDVDLTWHINGMKLIAEKTGFNESQLKSLSLNKEKEEIDDLFDRKINRIKKFRDIWFTNWRGRNKNNMQFCPICLKIDSIPYVRKEWRIGYYTYCKIHNCYLEKNCPSCNAPFLYYLSKWDKQIKYCYKCGANLSEIKPQFIQKDDSLIESTSKFLKNADYDDIHSVLTLTWLIAHYSKITDEIFNEHYLTHDIELIHIWNENATKINRLSLFSNAKLYYLIFGTAILFYKNEGLLDNFFRDYYINSHLWLQTGVFSCPIKECKYQSNDLSNMLQYMKRHNNIREFECTQCNLKFVTYNELKKHRNLHELPHPFACSVKDCGQKFRKSREFVHHIKKVHKLKPYKCPKCDLTFNKQSEVLIHLRTHNGLKPIICDICGKAFAQKSGLNTYRKTHTKEKNHGCEICGK